MSKKSLRHSLFANKRSIVEYRLFLDGLDEYNELEIHEIYNDLLESGTDDTLEVIINSHGGFLKSGMSLLNIMETNFQGKSITKINSHAYSMAAIIFLMGEQRIIYPQSSLMLHEISTGYVGKVNEIIDQLNHDKDIYKRHYETYIKPYLTSDDWKKFKQGKNLWFNCDEMCERSIATHVMVNNKLIDVNDYQGVNND